MAVAAYFKGLAGARERLENHAEEKIQGEVAEKQG
jgi:hypothetical protein